MVYFVYENKMLRKEFFGNLSFENIFEYQNTGCANKNETGSVTLRRMYFL